MVINGLEGVKGAKSVLILLPGSVGKMKEVWETITNCSQLIEDKVFEKMFKTRAWPIFDSRRGSTKYHRPDYPTFSLGVWRDGTFHLSKVLSPK